MKLIENHKREEIKKIYLTASGGPFLKLKLSKLKNIKPKSSNQTSKMENGQKNFNRLCFVNEQNA